MTRGSSSAGVLVGGVPPRLLTRQASRYRRSNGVAPHWDSGWRGVVLSGSAGGAGCCHKADPLWVPTISWSLLHASRDRFSWFNWAAVTAATVVEPSRVAPAAARSYPPAWLCFDRSTRGLLPAEVGRSVADVRTGALSGTGGLVDFLSDGSGGLPSPSGSSRHREYTLYLPLSSVWTRRAGVLLGRMPPGGVADANLRALSGTSVLGVLAEAVLLGRGTAGRRSLSVCSGSHWGLVVSVYRPPSWYPAGALDVGASVFRLWGLVSICLRAITLMDLASLNSTLVAASALADVPCGGSSGGSLEAAI